MVDELIKIYTGSLIICLIFAAVVPFMLPEKEYDGVVQDLVESLLVLSIIPMANTATAIVMLVVGFAYGIVMMMKGEESDDESNS